MSRFSVGDLINVKIGNYPSVFALKLSEYEFAFFEGQNGIFDDTKLDSQNILFVCRMNDSVEKADSWTSVGKIKLSDIYLKPIKYVDINFTNSTLYDDYLSILKTKVIPYGFAKGYPQHGAMYDVIHIENKLDDFFSGKADRYVEANIKMIEKLKLNNIKR